MIVFALLIIVLCLWAIFEARNAVEDPADDLVEERPYADWQFPDRNWEGRR